jgi:hypothetical protein
VSFVDRSLAKLAAEIEREALAKRRASPIRGTGSGGPLAPAWEYRVVDLGADVAVGAGAPGPPAAALESALNELGAEGWELVSHEPPARLVLKRPGPPAADA